MPAEDEIIMDLLSLPVVMVENILSYLTYDEIAKDRAVCKSFNEICMRMLNRGFLMIERRHAVALRTVKAQLPRRESERRYHPLSRHCDILASIETRISMLNMTYSKFIDSGICCFIPGKVIDEISRVLSVVEAAPSPPRAHEVLQELRDISSMAIEHFDEQVAPAFRTRLRGGTALPSTDPALGPSGIKQQLFHIRRRAFLNTKLSLYLASQYQKYYKRMMAYKKVALRQSKTIRKLTRRQSEQDLAIADLKKRIEECDIKYSELTHTNQAAGGKVIAASPTASVSSHSRHFASQIKLDLSVLPIGTSKRNQGKRLPNIKPRKPHIKLPSISVELPKHDAVVNERLKPTPSTSKELKPNTKTQSTMDRIRGFANEIRNLAKDTDRDFPGVKVSKRSISLYDLDYQTDVKKQKLD